MIDIGANLASPAFAKDLRSVLDRAHAAHVTSIVATGTSLEASQSVARIAGQSHLMPVLCTSGIHPHSASTANVAALENIEDLAKRFDDQF